MSPNAATPPANCEIDATDRLLLLALSRDGRQSASHLAKGLGLSRQAVAERMRDLEERGVIRGYHADVDPAALGLEVRAQLRLAFDGGAGPEKVSAVIHQLVTNPYVRAVNRVSGEDCVVVDLICRRIEDVNAILVRLQATRAIQSSRTAFVLEAVVDKRGLGPLAEDLLAPEHDPEG
jgi:Lrp/AsnC family leucine-responsive transcriptional regulator